MFKTKTKVNRRTALGALGTALALAAAPTADARSRLDDHPDDHPDARPAAISPPCGPQLQISVAYAFGLTGSPPILRHTHAFTVTLAHGQLVDGQTVTVVGATSGVLQPFVQHTHQIDSTGVLGASCGFSTKGGEHRFTLHAADFIVPS